jgi:hypothetical protein
MHFYYFIVFGTAFNKIFRAFKQIITGRLGTDHLTVMAKHFMRRAAEKVIHASAKTISKID